MVTVGICEDESWFADDLKEKTEQYLKERGLAGLVHMFENGEELLRTAGELDIVLMDIRLPGRDGMRIVKSMRDLGSGSQVIFVTSYGEYVFQAFDMDAVHYILKPVDREKLYGALDKALRRRGGSSALRRIRGLLSFWTKGFWRAVIFGCFPGSGRILRFAP